MPCYTKEQMFYLKELNGNECWCCKEKKRGFAFCYKCFKQLPDENQKALYAKVGQGYEAAYEKAVQILSEMD